MLFGSRAKGTERPDSDFDLAWLPTDEACPLKSELSFQAALTLAAGADVDLVRIDQASTLLKREITAHGVLLFGTKAEFVRFRAEAMSEWLDFAPALQHATERYRKAIAEGRCGATS